MNDLETVVGIASFEPPGALTVTLSTARPA